MTRHWRLIAALCLGLAVVAPAGGALAQGTGNGAAETDPWQVLTARPLLLPTISPGAPCPRSEGRRVKPIWSIAVGSGPVYATGFGLDGAINAGPASSPNRFLLKVIFFKEASDDNPALVRGARIDGPGEITFPDHNPVGQVRIDRRSPDNLGFGGYLRVPSAGCYAVQVDEPHLSEVIVFQVVAEQPEDLTPLPPFRSLPRDLVVYGALPLPYGTVRLALGSDQGPMVRIDVAPASSLPATLESGSQRLETAAGPVEWWPDASGTKPARARWDAAGRRYRLEIMDPETAAWSESDLRALVEQFATAARDWHAPAATPTA